MNDEPKIEYHRFTLRINKELFKVIKLFAADNRRAVGKEMEFALDRYYKQQQKNC